MANISVGFVPVIQALAPAQASSCTLCNRDRNGSRAQRLHQIGIKPSSIKFHPTQISHKFTRRSFIITLCDSKSNPSSSSSSSSEKVDNVNVSSNQLGDLIAKTQKNIIESANVAKQQVIKNNQQGLGLFRSFGLFSLYFSALMLMVRRTLMAATWPYERMLLSALAIMLPGLARYSFAELSRHIETLRNGTQGKYLQDFPYHIALSRLTSLLKVMGFFTAGFLNIAQGAIFVILSQLIFDLLIQFRWVDGSVFPIKMNSRGLSIVLDVISLGLVYMANIGLYPASASLGFVGIVAIYWLAKYDIRFF